MDFQFFLLFKSSFSIKIAEEYLLNPDRDDLFVELSEINAKSSFGSVLFIKEIFNRDWFQLKNEFYYNKTGRSAGA